MFLNSNDNLLIGTTSDGGQRLQVTGTVALRASASISSATQILIFNADPSGTTRELVTRTPAQLLSDIGGQAALTNPVTGTGTTNYLPKFTGSTTIGNSQIFDNGTNVGIGTTSPATRLMVQDSANTFVGHFSGLNQSNGIAIGTNSLNVAVIQGYTRTFSATNNIALQTDGGNLLVGTTTDTGERLQVSGNIRTNSGYVQIRNSSNPSLYINNGSAQWQQFVNSGNHLVFSDAINNVLTLGYNGSASYFQGGNLLVGTTTDNGARLQVNGRINAAGGVSNGVLVSSNSGSVTIPTTGLSLSTGFNVGYIQNFNGGNYVDLYYGASRHIFDGGNVGIGTSSPGTFLQVSGTSAKSLTGFFHTAITDLTTMGTGVGGGITFVGYKTAQTAQEAFAGIDGFKENSTAGNAAGTFRILTQPSSGAGLVEQMRITSGGNVLIGTTTDSGARLNVQTSGSAVGGIRLTSATNTNGSAFVASNAGGDSYFGRNNSTGGAFTGDSYSTVVYGGGNYPMGFYTNDTLRMTITSGGNVGIGTSSPGRQLEVYSATSDTRIAITNTTSTSGAAKGFELLLAGADAYAFNYVNGAMIFGTNSTERMRITAGGEVLIGNTDNGAYNLQCNGTGVWGAGAYVNGSDRNIKDNIATIEKGLEYIQKMNPVKFRYKPNYTRDHSMQTGFIAQELQEVFASEDYLSGLVQQGVHLSVAYQNLLPVLVKAIQEQQEIINDLKQKIQ